MTHRLLIYSKQNPLHIMNKKEENEKLRATIKNKQWVKRTTNRGV